MLSIYGLLECGLLVVNAIVILNEERFLSKIGWGRNSWAQHAYGGQQMAKPTVKSQLLNMIHSIRTVMRSNDWELPSFTTLDDKFESFRVIHSYNKFQTFDL